MTLSDLTGLSFSRLTVVASAFCSRPGRWWVCHCDCGGVAVRTTSQLRDRGRSVKSCGCARTESICKAARAAWAVTTKWNGPHKQRLKWLLGNMKRRCLNPRDSHYKYYGGRGIRIWQPWIDDPAGFYAWAIANGYRPGLSIDRIDPNGDYEPGNCRFISMARQASNTRRNRFLTRNGQTKTVAEWARTMGVRPQALQHRIDRGWSVERVFAQPFRGGAK